MVVIENLVIGTLHFGNSDFVMTWLREADRIEGDLAGVITGGFVAARERRVVCLVKFHLEGIVRGTAAQGLLRDRRCPFHGSVPDVGDIQGCGLLRLCAVIGNSRLQSPVFGFRHHHAHRVFLRVVSDFRIVALDFADDVVLGILAQEFDGLKGTCHGGLSFNAPEHQRLQNCGAALFQKLECEDLALPHGTAIQCLADVDNSLRALVDVGEDKAVVSRVGSTHHGDRIQHRCQLVDAIDGCFGDFDLRKVLRFICQQTIDLSVLFLNHIFVDIIRIVLSKVFPCIRDRAKGAVVRIISAVIDDGHRCFLGHRRIRIGVSRCQGERILVTGDAIGHTSLTLDILREVDGSFCFQFHLVGEGHTTSGVLHRVSGLICRSVGPGHDSFQILCRVAVCIHCILNNDFDLIRRIVVFQTVLHSAASEFRHIEQIFSDFAVREVHRRKFCGCGLFAFLDSDLGQQRTVVFQVIDCRGICTFQLECEGFTASCGFPSVNGLFRHDPCCRVGCVDVGVVDGDVRTVGFCNGTIRIHCTLNHSGSQCSGVVYTTSHCDVRGQVVPVGDFCHCVFALQRNVVERYCVILILFIIPVQRDFELAICIRSNVLFLQTVAQHTQAVDNRAFRCLQLHTEREVFRGGVSASRIDFLIQCQHANVCGIHKLDVVFLLRRTGHGVSFLEVFLNVGISILIHLSADKCRGLGGIKLDFFHTVERTFGEALHGEALPVSQFK